MRHLVPSVLIFLALGIFVVLSPRPKMENSIYRLTDEPFQSARDFGQAIKVFPGNEHLLSVIAELRPDQTLSDLERAMKITVHDEVEIWEQRSIFELRAVKLEEAEKGAHFPRLGSMISDGESLEKQAEKTPLAPFFYNSKKHIAYWEWIIRDDPPRLDPKGREPTLKKIKKSLETTLGPGVPIYFGGPYFIEHVFQTALKQNITLGIASALVLMIGIFAAFVRFSWALVTLVTIVLVQQCLFSGMGWAGHPISPLSSCLFLMMTVAIVEDLVLLFYVKITRKTSFIEAARVVRLASFLTSLSTTLGFGSLMFTDSPQVIHFALWAMAGTFLEWLLTMFACPPILDLFPDSPDRRNRRGFATGLAIRLAERMNAKVTGLSVPCLRVLRFGAVIVLLFSIWSVTRANVGYDQNESFSPSHPISMFTRAFQKMTGNAGEFDIFFAEKPSPERFEHIRTELSKEAGWKLLSYLDFLPPLPGKVSPELLRMAQRTFENAEDLSSYVQGNALRIRVFVPRVDSEYLNQAVERVRSICGADCLPTGETIVLNDMSLSFLYKLYRSLGGSLLLVSFVLTMVALRWDPKNLSAILGSSVWGPLTFLSVVVLLGLRVNVAMCLCITVFVGLAGDSAIQFLVSRDSKTSLLESIGSLAPASGVTFFLMSLSSATFAFSQFAMTRRLSWLFPIGFVILYFGDVLVLQLFITKKPVKLGPKPASL